MYNIQYHNSSLEWNLACRWRIPHWVCQCICLLLESENEKWGQDPWSWSGHQDRSDETANTCLLGSVRGWWSYACPSTKIDMQQSSMLTPPPWQHRKDHWAVLCWLSSTLCSVPANDKLILLGKFNAHVGYDHSQWGRVLDMSGIGNMNSNGLLLLSKCAEYELLFTNTVLRLANKYKTTWIPARSGPWLVINYVSICQYDIRDVLTTRAMGGSDCWTDHRLVHATFKMNIAQCHLKWPKLIHTAFNTSRFQNLSYLHKYQSSLDERLSANGPLTGGPTQKWNLFKDMVSKTAKTVLGEKKCTCQDWFDENNSTIRDLLPKKNKEFIEEQNDPGSIPKKERFKSFQAWFQQRDPEDAWQVMDKESQRGAELCWYQQLASEYQLH